MSSKDNASVFDYIGMLKHERRILLLKALFEEKKPIAFMDLLRKCKLPANASPDASYHLTELKDKGIVVQQETKYFLSSFGEALLEKFFDLEDVFSEYTAGILVRTSRYSMEPFSEDKIAAALMREAKMPTDKAAEIARDTRIRLQRAKVQYLTTPLIREYINAILVEKHMEDYRHRLTRLGVPGQDIEDTLRTNGVSGLPKLLASVSQETLEQFVLLRIFPKELADATLQRLIGVSRLALFPFLPEEVVVPWTDCGGDEIASLEDLMLILLRIVSTHIDHFGKMLMIIGVPVPSHLQVPNTMKIEGIARAIEHFLMLEGMQVRIIFASETLPEILQTQDFAKSMGNHVEFFCHRESSQLSLPAFHDPTYYGSLDNVVPCFESFYINLLLFLQTANNEADLAPEMERISEVISGILSVKEESMLTYGQTVSNKDTRLIRVCPVGLPEIVRLRREFDIDQTEDSQIYARDLLHQLQARVSAKLGGQYQVEIEQSWLSPHLLPFTEAAVNEMKELRNILYKSETAPLCSPGFTRLDGKWPATKCIALAGRVLEHLPGAFYLNLELDAAGRETKIDTPSKFHLEKGQSIFLTHHNRLRIGTLEVPAGNFF